ncbi:hypothetical protein B0H14DRAFT_3129119, partial [Mycena olivaceomarginata]
MRMRDVECGRMPYGGCMGDVFWWGIGVRGRWPPRSEEREGPRDGARRPARERIKNGQVDVGGGQSLLTAPAIYAPGAPTATQAARAGRPAHRKIGARSRSSPPRRPAQRSLLGAGPRRQRSCPRKALLPAASPDEPILGQRHGPLARVPCLERERGAVRAVETPGPVRHVVLHSVLLGEDIVASSWGEYGEDSEDTGIDSAEG